MFHRPSLIFSTPQQERSQQIALVLEWARSIASKVSMKVPNFEPKTWQDGKLFCALVTHYRPDLLLVEQVDCRIVFEAAEILGITISLDTKKPETWNTWAVAAQVLEFYEALSGRDVISSPGVKRNSVGGSKLSPGEMEQATGLPNLSHLSSQVAISQSMLEWLDHRGLKKYLKKSLDFGFDDPAAIRTLQKEEIMAWAEAVGMKKKHRDILLQGWMTERALALTAEQKSFRTPAEKKKLSPARHSKSISSPPILGQAFSSPDSSPEVSNAAPRLSVVRDSIPSQEKDGQSSPAVSVPGAAKSPVAKQRSVLTPRSSSRRAASVSVSVKRPSGIISPSQASRAISPPAG